MTCSCCYCNEPQEVEAPPALHKCSKCKREFRVYLNYSGSKIEMGADAKRFFEMKTLKETA
jgi:hypothetical protein